MLVAKRESRFVSFHAVQVLLLQVCYFVAWIFLMAGWVAAFLVTALSKHGTAQGANQFPLPMFLFLGLMILWGGAFLLLVLFSIIYGVKAINGQWAEYPLLGRWARRLVGIAKDDSTRGCEGP